MIASAATQTHTSQDTYWGNTTHNPYMTLVSPASVSAGVNWNVRFVTLRSRPGRRAASDNASVVVMTTT